MSKNRIPRKEKKKMKKFHRLLLAFAESTNRTAGALHRMSVSWDRLRGAMFHIDSVGGNA